MQIKFTAQKLKEANKYVNLLNPPQVKIPKVVKYLQKESILKQIFKFLFK